jgi:hypothetical protein
MKRAVRQITFSPVTLFCSLRFQARPSKFSETPKSWIDLVRDGYLTGFDRPTDFTD